MIVFSFTVFHQPSSQGRSSSLTLERERRKTWRSNFSASGLNRPRFEVDKKNITTKSDNKRPLPRDYFFWETRDQTQNQVLSSLAPGEEERPWERGWVFYETCNLLSQILLLPLFFSCTIFHGKLVRVTGREMYDRLLLVTHLQVFIQVVN